MKTGQMKQGQIMQANESFPPFYIKGDKFKIISIIDDEDMLPIEAIRLKNNTSHYFEYGELI